MVTGTRFGVMFIRTLPVLLMQNSSNMSMIPKWPKNSREKKSHPVFHSVLCIVLFFILKLISPVCLKVFIISDLIVAQD
jgi:hypothetical protein